MQLQPLSVRGGAEHDSPRVSAAPLFFSASASQGEGSGTPRGMCELLGSVISFLLSRISAFNASVEDHSGILKVFQCFVN